MTCFQYAKNGVVKNSTENKLRVWHCERAHIHTYVCTYGSVYIQANKHINIRASQPCRTPQHLTTCVSVHKRLGNVASKRQQANQADNDITST